MIRFTLFARCWTWALFGVFLLVACTSCVGDSSERSGNRSIALADRIELLEDPTGDLSIEELSSSPRTDPFRYESGPINLGLSQSAFWFRLKLDTERLGDARWVLSLGAFLDRVDAYATTDPPGTAPSRWERLVSADFPAEGMVPVSYELPRHHGNALWLLIRVESLDTIIFSPRLTQSTSYVHKRYAASLRKGIYYGVMIGAIVYNLFLAVWLRDRAYALYVVFEAAFCATVAGMDRTLASVLPATLPALRSGLTERLMGITAVAAVLFARDFLDLRASRRILFGSMATVIAGVALIFFPLGLGRQLFYAYSYIFVICATLFVSFMALFSWRRGNENAPLFVLAWSALLFVTVLGSLMNLGMVMPQFDVIDAIRIGSGTEAMLLAVALARRMSLIRRGEADARAALAEARLGLSKMLQRQVTSLNTLVGGVAHEIGNPLNFADGGAKDVVQRLIQAEGLAGELSQDWSARRAQSLRDVIGAARRSAGLAARGTERIDGIVRNLRAYVGTGSQPAELTDLDECIRSTLTLLDTHLRSKHIEVVLDLGLRTRAHCCPGEMNQVIMNLLLNACQAMTDGGKIVVESRETAASLCIVVTDTGPGVPASRRQAIFDPFFTTRAPNEGTGLGLAVSLEIVRRHGGKLDLLPARPHETGAAFAITLSKSQ